MRNILALVRRLRGSIVGADVVKLNSRRDLNGMTAMVAAKMVKEIVANLA